jgi:zinc transporter ZupT
MTVSSLWIGLLAAACTCAGLAIVRRASLAARARSLLTLAAAGLVLFLVIEAGYQALGTLELAILGQSPASAVFTAAVLTAGLLCGMVGLAIVESRRGHPGADSPQALDVAVMLAVGIGLRTFAEGLSVGQVIATSLSGPGALAIGGLAWLSLISGAAVAAPVAGQPMPPGRVLLLAACAAAPSVFGTITGTTWVGPGLELLVLSLASGIFIYVLRELLRASVDTVAAPAAMWAIAFGLFAGLAGELLVATGRLPARLEMSGWHASALVHAAGQPPGRLRPPAAVPCDRDRLTSYSGRVESYKAAPDETVLVMQTDEDTRETIRVAHKGARDGRAHYLIGGVPWTAEAWKRIEPSPGTLANGQRATAWVCTDGRLVVDWTLKPG